MIQQKIVQNLMVLAFSINERKHCKNMNFTVGPQLFVITMYQNDYEQND